MIRNKACEYAEKRAKVLTKRIVETYREAARDIAKKMSDFAARHEKQDMILREKLKRGEISEKDYKDWLKNEVFIGQSWQKKLDDVTQAYMNADKVANGIIRKESVSVFGKASNLTASDIGRHIGDDTVLSPVDSKAVEWLLKNDRSLLPEYKINAEKDYVWNSKRVQNAVAQGIIQGESVDEIAKRLSVELASKNAAKMNMFARTSVTAARTQGQLERMREAERKGIRIMKQWRTVGDERVREDHVAVNGDIREIDEPFYVGGYAMDGPADPNGPIEEVINCRCWLVEHYPR